MPTFALRRPLPLWTRAVLGGLVVIAVAAVVMLATQDDGAAAEGGLDIGQVTIDRPANPTQAAVRFVVANKTADPDALVAVSSPDAEAAMVHRSLIDSAGRATMEHVASLPVPAGGEVRFEAGGLHVMLAGLQRTLEVGDEVPVDLTFEQAGTVRVVAKVVEPGTGEAADG